MSPLKITLIQSSLHWQDKDANILRFEEKIKSIKEPIHIIVLPEMFTTGFSMEAKSLAEPMNGSTMQWMKRMAKEHRCILTGSIIIQENGRYYNRLIWMQPDGNYGFYDKRHLFANAGEDKHYECGHKRFIASVNGWKINLMICYDLRFPVWARQQANEEGGYEYDVLIYIANWPDKRNHAWKTLLQARAIENQCYAIGVNRVGEDANGHHYSGNSMAVDPLGEVLYHKEHEEDVYTVTFQRQHLNAVREKLPFLHEADPFLIIQPSPERYPDA
ncbi:MAG TPA: amidohydrolase [Chitinophagaceae bacterium]|nr:amidohydrolase [Chitinophagaceae bacterium]